MLYYDTISKLGHKDQRSSSHLDFFEIPTLRQIHDATSNVGCSVALQY